ncbi:hypothetical protein GCM10018780_07220 [Streptomyces lanatus]|nr:hypothetical protein GCM10018780_07220 [Streptomyces lanatus]
MSHAPDHGRDHWPKRLIAASPLLPIVIVTALVLVDLVGGSEMTWVPLLATGPALAATTTCGPRAVLGVGLLSAAVGVSLGLRGDAPDSQLAVALCALLVVTLACGATSALRGRRERVLAAVRSVAEAAQHALLQPVPATVGPFQVAVRYSAAAAEARIGGDLYALVSTPYGVRLIVGDVRGKGLPAVGTAALVLGVFREAAHDEPDLLDVVARIERSLARNLGSDDFVTAVVAGYPREGQLEVVNCGHAPPLLVRDSTVVPVDPARPAPPLGLRALSGETPALHVLPFSAGDQLLLYTDGVTEARNHDREFYPLAEALARHTCDEPVDTVTALHNELQTHVGGRLHDDAALLLLRMPAGREMPDAAGGASVSGGAGREAEVGQGAAAGQGAAPGLGAAAGQEAAATGGTVPVRETPATDGTAPGGETPTTSRTSPGGETPTTSRTTPGRETPTTARTPATGEASALGEASATGESSGTGESSATHASTTRHRAPATHQTPATPHPPATGAGPATRDPSVSREPIHPYEASDTRPTTPARKMPHTRQTPQPYPHPHEPANSCSP